MSTETPTQIWLMRGAFVLLTLVFLFANLLPIDTAAPQGWAGVDLLMLFAFAWSLRRPDYVPALLLAGLFLLADLLLQRPPGLWAALMLLACERMKAQAHTLRDAGLPTECLNVGILIVLIYLANRLILGLVVVDLPSLGLYLLQMIVTLLAYPVVIFVTHVFMGVRKTAPSDVGIVGTGS